MLTQSLCWVSAIAQNATTVAYVTTPKAYARATVSFPVVLASLRSPQETRAIAGSTLRSLRHAPVPRRVVGTAHAAARPISSAPASRVSQAMTAPFRRARKGKRGGTNRPRPTLHTEWWSALEGASARVGNAHARLATKVLRANVSLALLTQN